MADMLDEVLESRDAELLTTGLKFTEGPVWHPDGYLYFTNHPEIWRLDPKTKERFPVAHNSTGGNGMTLDLHGRLVVCEPWGRRVYRLEEDGSRTPLAVTWRGLRLNKPNDVIFRSDGTMYFTDMGYWPYTVGVANPEIRANHIFGVTPDGEVFAAAPYEYPNGLALSPDERTLYVANTRYYKHVGAFDVLADGSLANTRVFAELGELEKPGVPDGLKVDMEGNVYCTGPGGMWVFDDSGAHLGTVILPELPANMGWGDDDNRSMYVCARTSVYRLRMKVPGTKLPRAK
ncbi:MAG: SMP-30/gluconolactonase/LRE family protein [SAR202 cluster bacterium]|nr:SMP-30/gluconolactonase/LRE family protein [SAR202 cluster bacterium]